MLPPPTTTPSATPSACVATRSAAMRSSVGWWMPKSLGAHQGLAGDLHDARGGRSAWPWRAPSPIRCRRCRTAAGSHAAAISVGSTGCRDLGGEIGVRPVDALAERVAHEAGDLDRRADLAFGFLDRLRDVLVRLVDEGLIEQADLLVEGLEPRFDDLVDDIRRFALRLELVGEHVLLAPDHVRIEARRDRAPADWRRRRASRPCGRSA